MTESTPAPASIVLVHGLWMTPLSWEKWIKRFSTKGHTAIAPGWPGVGDDIQALRKDPSGLAGLSIKKIVDYYADIIRALPSPPIIMGHSFGGLFTQLLLDSGLGRAGVAIDSAPPKGIWFLPPSALRSAFPALDNPLNYGKAKGLTPKQFRYAFGNLLSEEESNRVFETYAIPGPDRLLFQAALANVNPRSEAKVNFKNNDRPPLLLIAGGKDHVVPASLTKTNFGLYHRSKAITAYKEFPDRSHWTCGQDGWENVADFALDWALNPKALPA